eukprot:4871824-Alexandrium_andersonii.AAC.1
MDAGSRRRGGGPPAWRMSVRSGPADQPLLGRERPHIARTTTHQGGGPRPREHASSGGRRGRNGGGDRHTP